MPTKDEAAQDREAFELHIRNGTNAVKAAYSAIKAEHAAEIAKHWKTIFDLCDSMQDFADQYDALSMKHDRLREMVQAQKKEAERLGDQVQRLQGVSDEKALEVARLQVKLAQALASELSTLPSRNRARAAAVNAGRDGGKGNDEAEEADQRAGDDPDDEDVDEPPVPKRAKQVAADPEQEPVEIKRGAKVSVRFMASHGYARQRTEWHDGKIVKVNVDGTVNILYDDGDQEANVFPMYIRAQKQLAAPAPAQQSRAARAIRAAQRGGDAQREDDGDYGAGPIAVSKQRRRTTHVESYSEIVGRSRPAQADVCASPAHASPARTSRPARPAATSGGSRGGGSQQKVSAQRKRPRTDGAPDSASGGKQRRVPWSEEEEEELRRLLAVHGRQWVKIHADGEGVFNAKRSAQDLKDKVRNMKLE